MADDRVRDNEQRRVYLQEVKDSLSRQDGGADYLYFIVVDKALAMFGTAEKFWQTYEEYMAYLLTELGAASFNDIENADFGYKYARDFYSTHDHIRTAWDSVENIEKFEELETSDVPESMTDGTYAVIVSSILELAETLQEKSYDFSAVACNAAKVIESELLDDYRY